MSPAPAGVDGESDGGSLNAADTPGWLTGHEEEQSRRADPESGSDSSTSCSAAQRHRFALLLSLVSVSEQQRWDDSGSIVNLQTQIKAGADAA